MTSKGGYPANWKGGGGGGEPLFLQAAFPSLSFGRSLSPFTSSSSAANSLGISRALMGSEEEEDALFCPPSILPPLPLFPKEEKSFFGVIQSFT